MTLQTINFSDIQPFFKPRPHDAHKGLFGRVLVIGGDYGMPGAVRLAAEGCLRTGAGLVTVFTRAAHISIVVSQRPELLCYGATYSLRILTRLLEQATLVVIGSGLGQSLWSKRVFAKVMASDLPKIIDADGLNLLARHAQIPKNPSWILTPHPGEAGRLLGKPVAEIQKNRSAAVLELQQRYGGVIALKGAGTLIAASDQPPVQCAAGNPAMATAGMGDVLAGIMGGLVAQGLSLLEAAQAGVVMHATAADRVVEKHGQRGLLAGDLFVELASL